MLPTVLQDKENLEMANNQSNEVSDYAENNMCPFTLVLRPP
jgi:hypothetical protein